MRAHLPLVAAFLGLFTPAPSAQNIELQAGVSAVWEVPTNPSLACASASFSYDVGTRILSYDVQATGLSATAAHLHDGDVGVGGPIVFTLTGGPTSWVGATSPLSAAQEADLLREGFYVNIHTTAFPGGEIRGQIVA
ncbi:MAG: CHRD domain-containing protein, partial [Planctomycetota bacterium]|nr:CHRD domain-containing protein [Planctomycetota bacterium]